MGDANTINADPLLSNALGGVKLNIRATDLDKAKVILTELEKARKKETTNEKIPAKFSKGFVKVYTFCPKCDSMDIYKNKIHWFRYILAVFISSLEKNVLDQPHYCADCGEEWIQ